MKVEKVLSQKHDVNTCQVTGRYEVNAIKWVIFQNNCCFFHISKFNFQSYLTPFISLPNGE